MSQAGASRGTVDPTPPIRHEFADLNGVRLHYAIAEPSTNAQARTGAQPSSTASATPSTNIDQPSVGKSPSADAGESAGAREETRTEASAEKPQLLIFLHGFPEFWYAWREQLAEFGRDFIAVAPDMRGYNLSSKPAAVEDYDIAKLVGDVHALVQHLAKAHHLSAAKCFLVGHDWGGVIAWAVAMACPDMVERLVIINAPHPKIFQRELRENPKQQEASQYMLLLRSPQAEDMMSANGYALMQQGILEPGIKEGYFSEDDRKAYVEAWAQPGALTGGLNYYRAAEVGPSGDGHDAFKMKHALASFEVKMPTLVIWGQNDPYLLTDNLNGLERYVADLTVELIPDATHWVVHEKPERVNALIRDFTTSGE
jgi:epoxide hydrolase 4